MRDLFRSFAAALRASTKASGRSMIVASAVGTAIYTGYGILWLYVTPVEYESFGLRSIGVLLCLAVCLSPRWPARARPLLPWVWFAAVLYALPFYSTYQLLGSNYSVLRSMLEVTMVFFVIVIFPHYLLALVNIGAGIALGVLAGWLTIPHFDTLNHAIVKSVHVQAMVYSVAAGLLFMRNNLKALLGQQRVETLQDLAGSIAHELRNPLGQLRYRLESISRNLPRPTADGRDVAMPVRELDAVYKELTQGKLAIDRGMQMIAMTLDEIHSKPPDTSNMRYLSAERTTRKAVDEFGYESPTHRLRVDLRVAEDFVFKGDETRYIFILFNLLKNALHYFGDHPRARVTITVGGQCVTFEDTGPGMTSDVLAHVFESFQTSGKADGTGLGLSFCKRTMLAFGGDIACESEPDQFTRFVLRFPVVAPADIAAHEARVLEQARMAFAGKRVLVVDDVAALRKTTRCMLEPLGVQVAEAENGQQALDVLSQGPFDAMVLDVSMPVLDGYATAESIRAGRIPGMARLPIVAYTAESPYVARAKLERVSVDALVHKQCSQVELVEALTRAYDHARRGEDTDLAAAGLAGKTILLVDDQEFNRRYLRLLLEERRIEVVEASDGAAALKMLELVAVDAIITDIHMPVLDGFGLARAVGASALSPKPVLIALSARDDQTALANARAAGIGALVSKPAEPGELLGALARQLAARPEAPLSPRETKPATPDAAAKELLNFNRLESLRRIGMIDEAVPEALQATRVLLGKLQDPVARRDLESARELLHSLIGICGDVGAHALHQKMRSTYALLIEHQQWPATGWHEEVLDLLVHTGRAIQERYLQQMEPTAGLQ
nr:response regulator [Ramlibacter alkalitolerans]